MRVLVCGSRHFTYYELLERTLDEIEITTIIHGEARGADTLSGIYAERRGLDVLSFPAQWDLFGKSAGPIRNAQMLTEGNPDLVVAFIASNSRGTKNMVDIAKKANIPVKEIKI